MKRYLCLMLALVMVLALAACGMDKPVETTAPMETEEPVETLPAETEEPIETPRISDEPKVSNALDAIRDYDPDDLDSAVMRYAAAARVLNFCRSTERGAEELKDEIKAYFARMSAEEKAAFAERYEDVAALTQSIAKGDVEQSELDNMLTEAHVDFDPVDPVTFAHQNLADLDETIREAVKP